MTRCASTESEFWSDVFPRIADRAAEKHPELRADIARYSSEFRKFLQILKRATEPVAMISPRIDHLWHEFITCTAIYRDYCIRFAGRFLDHMPRTAWNPLPEQAIWNFFTAYEAEFGAVAASWFDGVSEQDVLSLNRGEVPTALRWSGYVPLGMDTAWAQREQ